MASTLGARHNPSRHEDTLVAGTLRSHPRPGSNRNGALAFHVTQDPISGDVAPAMGTESTIGVVQAFAWQQGVRPDGKPDRSYIARTGDYAGALSTSRVDAIAGPAHGVRRLTPRECERLQGFPDDWTLIDWKGKPSPDSRRYAALGNAVTVQVAEWIAHRIVAADAASYGPGADTSEGAA